MNSRWLPPVILVYQADQEEDVRTVRPPDGFQDQERDAYTCLHTLNGEFPSEGWHTCLPAWVEACAITHAIAGLNWRNELTIALSEMGRSLIAALPDEVIKDPLKAAAFIATSGRKFILDCCRQYNVPWAITGLRRCPDSNRMRDREYEDYLLEWVNRNRVLTWWDHEEMNDPIWQFLFAVSIALKWPIDNRWGSVGIWCFPKSGRQLMTENGRQLMT